MAVPGWYNENSLRAYPLIADPTPVMQLGTNMVTLPTQAIVDIGIELDSPGSDDPTQLAVYLQTITRADPVLSFTFTTTEQYLVDVPLVFTRSVNDAAWTISDSSVSLAGGTVNVPVVRHWRGWLVTGPLSWLLAVLPNGHSLVSSTPLPLEPSTWRTLAGTYVRSVVVTNYSRLTTSPPGEPAPPYVPIVVFGGLPLVGNLLCEEGYNLTIRQDDTEDTLTFSAAVGSGEGLPCAEIPLSPTEEPPAGSIYLTGGPSCAQTISSINGQTGPQFNLVGGDNVSIMTDPNNPSRIIVDLTTASSAAVCIVKPLAAKLWLLTKSPDTSMTPATTPGSQIYY